MLRKIVLISALVALLNISKIVGKKTDYSPPHCTHVTKDTDYASRFKFDYPVAYIIPGQHEAYQQLFCLNPASVNKAVTSVCDWIAPPQVQFTLGDEYMHVVRQDPTGMFLGNAVIITYQLCQHDMHNLTASVLVPNDGIVSSEAPKITRLPIISLDTYY